MSEPAPAKLGQTVSAGGTEVESTVPAPPLPGSGSLDLPLQPGPLPEVFAHYRILEQLGRGGMGTVYLAEDSRLGRKVALKVPHFASQDNDRRLERFRREARIAATFHHPGLCPVYDVGEVNGFHYVTMPFLRGEPLSALLRREGRMSPDRAVRFVTRVAQAVQVAHAAGVLHRDLKPDNIMVNEQGDPVVMDFGVARQLTTADPQLTGAVVLLGTPAYAPPEQIGGQPDTLGPPCDVYSLGVTLYEMLTGRLPFAGKTDEVLRQVLTRAPEPPSRFVAGLDPHLDALCLRAMAKDPAARFPSMAAFADALGRALEGNPAQPATLPLARPTGRRPRRRMLLLAVGLVLLLVAGTLAVLLLSGQGRRPHQQSASPPTDSLQAGSRWSGPYEWQHNGGGGEAFLTITERQGNDFKGTYATREGQGRYQWEIEGAVEGSVVRWRFTRVIHEDQPTRVVEKARVQGTLDGPALELGFHDDSDSSDARLHLHLEK